MGSIQIVSSMIIKLGNEPPFIMTQKQLNASVPAAQQMLNMTELAKNNGCNKIIYLARQLKKAAALLRQYELHPGFNRNLGLFLIL